MELESSLYCVWFCVAEPANPPHTALIIASIRKHREGSVQLVNNKHRSAKVQI